MARTWKSDEKPYKFDQCDCAYTQARKLQEHKGTHTGERVHKFDQFNIQMRRHTWEEPYRCTSYLATHSNRGLLGLIFNRELARLVYLRLWVNYLRPHTMCKASHFLLEDPNESSLGEIIAKGQVPSAKKGAKVLLQYSINSTHFPRITQDCLPKGKC